VENSEGDVSMTTFTLDQLKEYDGKDGRPIYVVIDGHVYDISASALWEDGRHMEMHDAGADLTADIAKSPHGPSVLEFFECVGELVESESEPPPVPERSRPVWIGKLLDMHPHPLSVHFPIALTLTASALILLRWIVDVAVMDTAAFFNLILAAIATPVSVCTGLFSHHCNYKGAWTTVFKRKMALSCVLVVLLIITLWVRISMPAPVTEPLSGFTLYHVLVFACAHIVMALGYLGGTITFPSSRTKS
jgi:predicted heme/steroid binding protein/uncharacterized membrane protein